MNDAQHRNADRRKIFISHAWEDNAVVERIKQELVMAGAEVWVDYHATKPGDRISAEVSRALAWCDVFLLIWSAKACASQWVEQEWGAANSNHKKIIPCLLDDAKLPALFADTVHVDFCDFDKGTASLLRILEGPVDKTDMSVSEELANSNRGDVMTMTETMNIELKIDQDFDKFTIEQQKHLLRAIGELLGVSGEIKIKGIRRGSVHLTIELPADKAEKLLWMVKSGQLERHGVVGAEVKDAELFDQRLASNAGITEDVLYPRQESELSTWLGRGQSGSDAVTKMLRDRGYYDWSKNPAGTGVEHQYERRGEVVFDATTGLTWQQSGSKNYVNYPDAQQYTRNLNDEHFAGYSDWRLPTLEEAMSLVEPSKKNDNLHIDPVFDKAQISIWTIKERDAGVAWVVNFGDGGCSSYDLGSSLDYVRAVR